MRRSLATDGVTGRHPRWMAAAALDTNRFPGAKQARAGGADTKDEFVAAFATALATQLNVPQEKVAAAFDGNCRPKHH